MAKINAGTGPCGDASTLHGNGILPTNEVDPKQPWSSLQCKPDAPGFYASGIETGLYRTGVEGANPPDIGSGNTYPQSVFSPTPRTDDQCSVSNPNPSKPFHATGM